MFRNKKKLGMGIVFFAAAWLGYSQYASVTHIGFVNFADHQFAPIRQANDNPLIQLHRIDFQSGKDFNLKKYDVIYFFAHAINLSEKQIEQIQAAGKSGTKLYLFGLLQGDADFGNLKGEDRERVKAYFENGGRKNLWSLLNYSRRVFDRKILFSRKIAEPVVYPNEGFFHLREEDVFASFEAYQRFYERKGFYKEGAPRIAIVSVVLGREGGRAFYEPLIRSFEKRGFNLYPVFGNDKRLEFLKGVNPSLIVLIPHGRLASEEGVAWLKKQNIPLLCPLVVFEEYEAWLKNQRGIDAGVLSQGVVMPEVDGGVSPYVIATQFADQSGLKVFKELPGRIETFCDLASRWIRLRTMPNAEKKITIFYYKGAGQNAMVAEGLEIAPSLLNLLRRLQAEGYNTGKLPENEDELLQKIQNDGRVLGPYAKGAFEEYLKSGDPVLIEKDQITEWMEKYFQPEMIADVEREYGRPIGEYMTLEKNGKPAVTVARVQFGNVVLLPVPLSAYGGNESKLVHGAKKAPPYPYLAAYLWGLRGFGADAFIHFGTHGSVEFTPWKQVALSQYDWPDALLNGIPHFYLYSISNIGEALVAKRRSYATMMTHITPPFTESGLYSDLAGLHDKVHEFQSIEDEAIKEEYRETIKGLLLKTNIYKDLGFDDFNSTSTVSDEMIDKIVEYGHSLAQGKITRGLYRLGENYRPEEMTETVRLIAVDYLAHGLEEMDSARGREILQTELHGHDLEQFYRGQAFALIDEILLNGASPEEFADLNGLEHYVAAHSHEWLPAGEHSHEHDRHQQDREHDHQTMSDGEVHSHSRESVLDQQKFNAAYELYQSTLSSIKNYYKAVESSPEIEMNTIVNALSGGYTAPASGGDPIVNPDSIPAGRNTYGIDAEKTPTEESWKTGVKLAERLIEIRQKETGAYPKKVAFTLWSSEFVREQGTTIAEILYLLGVEPVRNARGAVYDVRLIPMEKLKRPRIDVVVQTSGQFRDLAASRIYLINRAVELAANAKDS
ncbi:MAG: cobaltochelatase subunit CobN, partial [Candidatus Omnitrophica bacterium]|nr:cobaltochelatase subunit CobN [Candidatus Omnitrophota bacterium]